VDGEANVDVDALLRAARAMKPVHSFTRGLILPMCNEKPFFVLFVVPRKGLTSLMNP